MFMSTLPEREYLCDIVESVWAGFLGITVDRASGEPGTCECASSIRIEGAWNGMLVVACSRQLARQAAINMFHCNPERLRDEFLVDAMNEVANIIGGNVKSLLPSPSSLRLPRFHEDWHPLSVGQCATFRSGSDALYVILTEDD